MTGKSIYIGCLMLISGIAVSAGNYGKSIHVSNIELRINNQEVTINFVLQTDKKIVKSDYELIVQPVLRNKNDSLLLPEIVVQGRRARIAEKRHRTATGQKIKGDQLYTRDGERITYTTTTLYQDWMRNSQLVFNGVITGCCSAKEVVIGIITDGLLPDLPSAPEQEQLLTTADRLSNQFPFLAPIESLNQNPYGQKEIEDLINNNQKGALAVYFVQGGRIIDRNYKSNHETLVKLISVIRAINASNDSRVVRIVIAGFASPEGALSFNEQLAWDRGMALQQFVLASTSLSPQQVYVYNGSVDWQGLRKLVSNSTIPNKYQVLDIIDNRGQGNDNRLKWLMNLNEGETYRYMLTHFFPLLRNATYVKVYYENL